MSILQLLFWVSFAGAAGLAVRFGGRDERLVALALLLATLLSPVLVTHGYSNAESGVIAVDIALFIALSLVALKSSSFWPIWAAGFQLCTLAVHLAAAKVPNMLPAAYADTLVIWSYPVMAALALGTWLEARQSHVQG